MHPSRAPFSAARVLTAVLAATMVTSGGASAHEYTAGSLTVSHPWSRATPGGATVGAAFFEITSAAKEDDKLLAAATPAAGKVEIHTHEHADGVMRMRKIDNLPVPAGASVKLAPAGYHIMLFDLKKPLIEGELLPLTLTFEKAGAVTIDASIESVGAKGPHGLDSQPESPKASGHDGHAGSHDGH